MKQLKTMGTILKATQEVNGRYETAVQANYGKKPLFIMVSTKENPGLDTGDSVHVTGQLDLRDGLPFVYGSIKPPVDFNTVTISGNISSDAFVKQIKDDVIVADFSVAVNNGAGKEATFIKCSYYKCHPGLAKAFKKGVKVTVEGSLKTEKSDNNGKWYTSLQVNKVELHKTIAKEDNPYKKTRHK
jgi:hypothetical protein